MISAVILTWNSERHIERCIMRLAESADTAGFPLELFVVDNGSTDATNEIVDRLVETVPNLIVILIRLQKNHGTTYSRNLALRQVRGEYVVVLDADIECDADTLQILIGELKNNPMSGLASPKLVYPDGGMQVSYKRIPTAWTKICKALGSKIQYFKTVAEKDEGYAITKRQYPDYCISACWCMRKNMLAEVGYLDEHIFYAPEDVDYCVRMWLAGYRIVYLPEATAIHHTQRVSYSDARIAISHLKGLAYFFNKYQCWISRKNLYQRISKRLGIPYPLN